MGKISLSNMNNVGSYSSNKSTSKNYNYYNNDIYKNVDVSVEKSKKVYCGISGYISSEYNPTLIEIVKSAPERFWHSDRKCWEVAYTYLNDVLDKLKNNGFNISIDYKTNIDDMNNININNNNIEIPKDYEFITKPYGQFQLDGIKYGLNVNKFLLLDEQGLGKSYQSANIACIRKKFKNFKHCLVICCVNGNKYNWVEEVEKHTKEKGYIIGTRYRKTTGRKYIGSSADKLDDLKHMNDSFFQILNVEALIYSVTKDKILKNGKVKKIKEFPIVEQLQKLIANKDIGYIIVDEIHKIKDSTSQRGKALLDLDCDCVGMTGPPLMNTPVDLYSPLKFINAENHSLTQFKSHYCIFGGFGGHQIVSYKNLGELQNLLDKHSIRRLRKDELDLPPKIEITKYVELAKDQQAIYDEIKEETIDAIKNIDKVKMNFTPLTMFTRMRQCTGNPSILTTKNISNAKFDMLLELANELKANNEKFLVYSNWTSVLNDAYKLLSDNGFNPAIYTGQNTKEREGEKIKFKTNKNCLCLCGTIDAMGTGLTLTEATTVIFLDEPWTKANKSQAEDRAYRIGTKSSVNIITIIAKDTIDERIHDMVHKKGKMSDIIVDKEVDATANAKMVNYLLS